MSAGRVLFYVQHLLGIGHQRRGATLTRGLRAAGFDVTYVSGGHEVPNLSLAGADLVQLPPVRAVDLYFKKLVDENDRPIDDAWRDRRRRALLEAYENCVPDVIILELFPFGRRQMRFELLPLLEAAKARARPPLIVSSVRDILVAPPKPERLQEMLARVRQYFDLVLVHGDPDLVPFERTFPHAAEIAEKLRYTGYVVDRTGQTAAQGTVPDQGPKPGLNEVLVSAGGGAVGDQLLHAALDARPLTTLKSHTWRVLVGTKVPAETFAALKAREEPGVIVERARGDFPTLLMHCALSISQAGYNTLMECLHAGCRCLVSPYAGGLETEQTLRADLLAARDLLTVVPEDELTAENLAVNIDKAMLKQPGKKADFETDGARKCAAIIKQCLRERAIG